jgi:hypothetical protein
MNVVGFHTVVYVFNFNKDYELRTVFMSSLIVADPNLPLCLKSKINVFVSGAQFHKKFLIIQVCNYLESSLELKPKVIKLL